MGEKSEEDISEKIKGDLVKLKKEERVWRRRTLAGIFALTGLLIFFAIMLLVPFLHILYGYGLERPPQIFFFFTILPIVVIAIALLLLFTFIAVKLIWLGHKNAWKKHVERISSNKRH